MLRKINGRGCEALGSHNNNNSFPGISHFHSAVGKKTNIFIQELDLLVAFAFRSSKKQPVNDVCCLYSHIDPHSCVLFHPIHLLQLADLVASFFAFIR